MRTIRIDDEWLDEAIAESLLWSAENAEHKHMREACRTAAFYYMTFDQVAQYLGSIDEAERYFK